MQAYGASEVVLTVLSVGLVIAVGIALDRRANRGLSGAGGAAWAISVVTAVLGAVGFVYLLGVGVCLLLACGSVPYRFASDSRSASLVGTASRR